ncbi:MAG: hypothetical protein PHI59_08730 [Candidatus Omnitrophica bacterium]|nr:hypothetical protein [Candidatus Omnitrophota bacterium]
MAIEMTLLVILLLIAVWTVMTTRLLRSVVGLAATSVVLSIIMFRLNSPIAAVFELSVCAGLILVIFITTVSFTQRITKERLIERRRERFIKFWYLPFVLIIAGIFLSHLKVGIDFKLPPPGAGQDVQNVLWNLRHMDLLGQAVALLAGAFGVVVLFKEAKK